MKKQFIALILAVIISVPAFSQVKVGYMNPTEVLASLDEVAVIEARIDSLITQRDQQLVQKTTQLQQDVAAYEEGKSVMSADARANKEQEFLDRSDEIEEERETAMNEIRQRRIQLLTPVMDRMDAAIEKVASGRGLDLVINEATVYGDAILFYTHEDAPNITQAVIEELKAN